MKRRWFVMMALVGAMVSVLLATPAHAVKAFKDEFEVKYVKADSKTPADVALAEAVAKARCSVCHMAKSKKLRNAYGQALDQLLDREADADNKAKIGEALDKVAGMKCDPKDAASPTFGDRIKQGQLPCDSK